MRILVTGGAGFIGSALVRHLVRDVGADVLTVDKLTYAGNPASLKSIENAPNHRLLKADICDGAAMGVLGVILTKSPPGEPAAAALTVASVRPAQP